MPEYIVFADRDEIFSTSCDTFNTEFMKPIVRCRECKHFVHEGSNAGFEFCNEATHTACGKFSSGDLDWDYINWFYVDQYDFCAWGERRD